MTQRLRVMYFGSAANTIVRGRIAPFLPDVEALWVSTDPPPAALIREHPRLRVEVLPRLALRRLPRRLHLHTADYVAQVLALSRRFRPQLIHVHYVSQLDAATLLAVRRVPLILTVMGADVLADQVPRPWAVDVLVRRLFRRAAAITAKSRFLEARCRDLGARPERIHRVAWGIDTARFAPGDRQDARERLGLTELSEARVLLSSRALQPLYNHQSLLDAAAALEPSERPQLVFSRNAALPGYAQAVEQRARGLGLAATFLDPLPPDRMPDLYRAADACASIPASDGLPQTVLEALSCLRPTLALDLEAYAELPFAADALTRVRHSGGRPDPQALAEGLRATLAEGPRPGLEAARAWVEENAEFARSVEAVRRLYDRVAR